MQLKSLTLENIAQKCRMLLDRFRGLDFLTIIQPEEVGLDAKSAYRSSPSGDKYLEHLLTDFKISSQDAIIDIGCGKGSAMRTMLEFPFARVDGLELSETIAKIATRNFEKLRSTRTQIFIADAAQFKEYDAYNIVYLYNPFSCDIMLNVINAITQSIDRSDRELVIIYNNPTCSEEVTKNGAFTKIGTYPDKWGNQIAIYSNRSYTTSILRFNKDMKNFINKI